MVRHILVISSSGQVGTQFARTCGPRATEYHCTPDATTLKPVILTRADLNLTDPAAIAANITIVQVSINYIGGGRDAA